jgi:glycine betaine transporter
VQAATNDAIEYHRPIVDKPHRRPSLFVVALVCCAAVSVYALAAPDSLAGVVDGLTKRAFQALDWFFMAAVTGFLVLCGWLALGRYGKVRLGGPDDRPEFSRASWFSMLFAAGMGGGILFFGVAEPVTHFATPPLGVPGGGAQAARQAMVITHFHWGLHAWGIYCIGALVLAYFGFRRKTSYLAGSPVRASFKGAWVAPLAWSADLTAVLAVFFGVAAGICFQVLQIRTGIGVVTGAPVESDAVSVGILVALLACAITSASTGLDKGIKWLSNLNVIVAGLLLLFVLLAGPTGFLLRNAFSSLGDYLANIVSLTLRLYPYQDTGKWFHSWTLTYFVWWISWAPFVGIFVARISRGRTIREFVIGVLLTPTLASVFWFSIFGGTAIHEEMFGGGGIVRMVEADVTTAIFSMFHRLPLSTVLDVTGMLLMFVFQITSIDSATFVLGMLTSDGSHDPPRKKRLAWGGALGLLSAPLLLFGEIPVFKAVMVCGVLPYSLVMLVQAGGLIRGLGDEELT